MRLQNRTALISAAAGPMGGAIARRFLQEGANLVLTDISGRRLEAAASELAQDASDRIVAIRADAQNRAEAEQVVTAGRQAFGRIDILINVVGGIRDTVLSRPFQELSAERLSQTLSLNLLSTWNFVQLLISGMQQDRQGKIVNIASISMAGEVGQADYAAAKAGVAALTRSLAAEFAPHVNVNCISPALIQTSAVDRMDPDQIRSYIDRTLLKRLGKAEDIANAALFLASEEASYITGENLCVSGGIAPAL